MGRGEAVGICRPVDGSDRYCAYGKQRRQPGRREGVKRAARETRAVE